MENPQENHAGSIPKARRERLKLVISLLLLAAAYFLLSRQFAGDAAKATPRLAQSWTGGYWASVKDYAAFGTHWFAVVNAAILILGAATAPLWHRRWRDAAPAEEAAASVVLSSRAFAVGMVLIIGLATGLRWTTATGGFWHDEGLQMKRVSGNFQAEKTDAEGIPGFRAAPWIDTWFHFRKPTNHTVAGVPGRLTLEAWRAWTGAARHEFSELAVRLPSFLAGLATIGIVGWIGGRLGGKYAGWLAALLLAIHPWHIHWGVDLRAYSIGIFSTALGVAALIAAMDRGRWPAWITFGLAQFLLLWSSLMNLWLAIGFFLAAALLIWKRRDQRPVGPQWGRLVAANVIGATLFLQAMGPNLIQFVQASKIRNPSNEEFMKLDGVTFMDLASNLYLGLPHDVPTAPGDAPITTWNSMFARAPTAGWALAGASIALVLLGSISLFRRNQAAGWAVGSVFAAGAIHLAMTLALDWYYYPRFSTYLLPAVALAWAFAWQAMVGRVAVRWPAAGKLALPIGAVFLLATAWPQALNLVRHTHEPFPEMKALFAEKRKAAPGGQAITACYGLAGDIMQEIYDPRTRFVRTKEEVEALMAEAKAGNQPLFIAYGLQSFNRSAMPGGFVLLDDPRLFSMVHRLVSNDPRHTFFILQLN